MAIKQISVFAENKRGSAFASLDVLADAGVNLKALSISETTDYGIIRFIVADPESAGALLRKKGHVIAVTEVIGVEMPNVPGSLAKILGALSAAGINIEYLYAFITTTGNNAYVVFRVQDNGVAEAALKRGGFRLLTDEDIKGL